MSHKITIPDLPEPALYTTIRVYRKEDAAKVIKHDGTNNKDVGIVWETAADMVGREPNYVEEHGTPAEFLQDNGFDLAQETDHETFKDVLVAHLKEKRAILRQFKQDLLAETPEEVSRKGLVFQQAFKDSILDHRLHDSIAWDALYFDNQLSNEDRYVLKLSHAKLNHLRRKYESLLTILTASIDGDSQQQQGTP